MELVNLDKYLTPLERRGFTVYSDEIITGSEFYNTIFKKSVGDLRTRVFIENKNNQPISVISSIIPVNEVADNAPVNLEEQIDQAKNAVKVSHDIMLTWSNSLEAKLLQQRQAGLQILLRKTLIMTGKQEVIRYEEEAMLPNMFSLQKG